MISGIDLTATVDYALKDDKDNPTIWKLGVLPSFVLGQLSAKFAQEEQIAMTFKLLQIGIKGWQNFGGIEFKIVKETIFGRELDIVPLELIEKIPLTAIGELSAEILKINGLSIPEQKN